MTEFEFGCAILELGVLAAEVLALGRRRTAGGLTESAGAAVRDSVRSLLSSSESEPYEVSPAEGISAERLRSDRRANLAFGQKGKEVSDFASLSSRETRGNWARCDSSDTAGFYCSRCSRSW